MGASAGHGKRLSLVPGFDESVGRTHALMLVQQETRYGVERCRAMVLLGKYSVGRIDYLLGRTAWRARAEPRDNPDRHDRTKPWCGRYP